MEALLARTAQTLRGRFESLRPGGAIPVLMAETPKDHPLPRRGESSLPMPIFDWGYPQTPHWIYRSMVALDRRHIADRHVWLGVDLNAGQPLRRACREAGNFARFIRRHHGLPEECGASGLEGAWIWTVLELAEVGVPGSLLRLESNGVFRHANGGFRATEEQLAIVDSMPPDDFAAQILRMEYDPTRYWQHEDLVEASIQAMDIVEVLIASGASAPLAARGERGKSPRRKMRPEEHLMLLYFRNPKVATLDSRSLPAVAEAAFGESFSDRSYRDTDLYGEWRAALEETVRRLGSGCMEGDVLEAGLEIYAAKPGRSDKRPTLDPKHEVAVKDFLRDAGNAAIRAKARAEDGGK